MSNKFKKPEANPLLSPVDYFNFFGTMQLIFAGVKDCKMLDDNTVALPSPKDPPQDDLELPTFQFKDNVVHTLKENSYGLPIDQPISKFMLLTAVKCKGDYSLAMAHVYFNIMKAEIPYIRVGTDYFKVIKKTNRFNAENTLLKPWRKDEIKQDHGKSLLTMVYKFDDFTIEPDNISYRPVMRNCYNLYTEFAHKPVGVEVLEHNIPVTLTLVKHIFGEQWQLGLKYLKILYEHPKQILPVLALVSNERETGKTTFLNWIMMLFGENSTLINPTDLMSSFNDSYATKNIIMIDETVIDKAHTIEKLKSIATAKSLSVSQKFVSSYSVPFYGKVIVCTNKETDFMRIDEEEIRFWVRKIGTIVGAKNTNIESNLFDEIPLFLKYLTQLPEIDFSKSRMVFTQEEIKTDSLYKVKEESKSTVRKEIEYLISELFDGYPNLPELELTPKDIKDKWFLHNNQVGITYIRKVLKEEMKLTYSVDPKPYRGFPDSNYDLKVGRVYKFVNDKYDANRNNQYASNINNQLTIEPEEEDPF